MTSTPAGGAKLRSALQGRAISSGSFAARVAGRRRYASLAVSTLLLGALVSGFVVGAPSASAGARQLGSATPGPLRLITEPGSGIAPIYSLLGKAKHTLDVVMYELSDTEVDTLLADDAARGVRVRVILDKHYEQSANTPAFSFLASHHVLVRWASSRYDLTHEKSFVIDGATVVVMTLNFTARYYADTRDVAVVDTSSADAAAVETTFGADWSGSALAAPTGQDLLWSPGAEQPLLGLVASAKDSLLIENEEMDDAYVTSALEAAARRGVHVEVVMTNSSSWTSAFRELEAAGVEVLVYAPSAPLYIHAKVLVVDPGTANGRAFVGSQNFSVASLVYNRELGIETSDATVVAELAVMVRSDAAGATAWR